jgi:hypothetical protein
MSKDELGSRVAWIATGIRAFRVGLCVFLDRSFAWTRIGGSGGRRQAADPWCFWWLGWISAGLIDGMARGHMARTKTPGMSAVYPFHMYISVVFG